jgi:hypothetical protein
MWKTKRHKDKKTKRQYRKIERHRKQNGKNRKKKNEGEPRGFNYFLDPSKMFFFFFSFKDV